MDIIYFNGLQFEGVFSSSFNKIDLLKNAPFIDIRDNIYPIEIDYYNNLEESIQLIKHSLSYERFDKFYRHRNSKFIFIGTSLGSFFAYYFSKLYSSPALLINPCYNPSVQLSKYIGERVGTPNFGFSKFQENSLKIFKSFEDSLSSLRHANPEFIKIVINRDDKISPYNSELEIRRLKIAMPEGKLYQYDKGGYYVSNFNRILIDIFEPLYKDYKNFSSDSYSNIAI